MELLDKEDGASYAGTVNFTDANGFKEAVVEGDGAVNLTAAKGFEVGCAAVTVAVVVAESDAEDGTSSPVVAIVSPFTGSGYDLESCSAYSM